MESCFGDNRLIKGIFIIFLNCLDHHFWWSRTLVIAFPSGMAVSVQIWIDMHFWFCLTLLSVESPLDDSNKFVANLIRFLKS
jgi:hypothetical protein